jgi:hypothetical protein
VALQRPEVGADQCLEFRGVRPDVCPVDYVLFEEFGGQVVQQVVVGCDGVSAAHPREAATADLGHTAVTFGVLVPPVLVAEHRPELDPGVPGHGGEAPKLASCE